MNCIIIDDEELAREILKKLIKRHINLNLVGSFESAVEAMKFLNDEKVDLIFLDIHLMPNFTGFDFIQTIKNPPQTILTTFDKKFALKAFEYASIIDYLIKPITAQRFDKALKKIGKVLEKKEKITEKTENKEVTGLNNQLYINVEKRLVKIDIPNISVIESKGDYILIRTTDKNYTVHSTLKKIEKKLPAELFLKIHRSFVINLKKIIDIEDNSVLIGKQVIPVSRNNRPELLKRINLL